MHLQKQFWLTASDLSGNLIGIGLFWDISYSGWVGEDGNSDWRNPKKAFELEWLFIIWFKTARQSDFEKNF